jgi:hypothetical protein
MSLWFDGTYGGRQYTLFATRNKKEDADKQVIIARRRGYSTRIDKQPRRNGFAYDVWVTKKIVRK